MTATHPLNTSDSKFANAIAQACHSIAPTWPLDKSIAVNPFWKMIDQPFSEVSAKLAALRQIQCVQTHAPHNSAPVWQNINELVDNATLNNTAIPWKDEVIQQISQFCAAYFQQLDLAPTSQSTPLYVNWLTVTQQDMGIALVTNSPNLPQYIGDLPKDPVQLIDQALIELEVAPNMASDYLQALLLDINGWASWVAYLEWQANLKSEQLEMMHELLAIRLAWELIIMRYVDEQRTQLASKVKQVWQQQLQDYPSFKAQHLKAQQPDWQATIERESAFQTALESEFINAQKVKAQTTSPKLQAAFCIDVRSEPMRRALELCDEHIETLGFAGFFGLPINYNVTGSHYQREQLPGLLAPSLNVSADIKPLSKVKRIAMLSHQTATQNWERHGLSSFSMVEAKGLLYAFKLLKQSFLGHTHQHPVNHLDNKLSFEIKRDNQALTIGEKAKLATGILTAMTLTKNFAPIVLLVGHGSHTTNNAQAASLDCGACGGQTGEINARILASLLNNNEVRIALDKLGIFIPQTTRFIAALHNTTNDEIQVFDNALPTEIDNWLSAAQLSCQQARASKLNAPSTDTKQLFKWFNQTCHDWSAIRPEWGLANNAALIVAKRHKTKHMDLKGRCFLHEYDWQQDTDFSILELIMTAPMVVTNWINSQYNASVADNRVYGSGNKLLHNVVGGHIGLFEGNGGDLRIGLAMQSIHNGRDWMHEFIRLSVYIDAPKAEIEKVANKHSIVKQLIDNDWLYLHCLPNETQGIERYYKNSWHLKHPSATLKNGQTQHRNSDGQNVRAGLEIEAFIE